MIYRYKPIGKTCGEVINELKKEDPIKYNKVCFCGRLDPLAHGKMLYLYGNETKNIKQYLTHNKKYKFKFVIGLSTDTTDMMGLFNNFDYDDIIDIDILLDYIDNIIVNKSFLQKYHNFSSFVPKGGKMPLWLLSKHNIHTQDYYKNVIIHALNIIDIKYINKIDIINEAIANIKKITNQIEFRIPIIMEQYLTLIQEIKKNNNILHLPLLEIQIDIFVSSGFYIRQFIQDLSDHFKVKMIVTDIHRYDFN